MSLRKSAQHALLWSAGLNVVRDVIQFGQMLIMVRLLEPAMYGQSGLAIATVTFIGVLGFHNFVSHSLQIRDGSIDWQQHFAVGLRINSTLFLVCNVAAMGLSFIETYAPLQPLLHLLSLTFLLSIPNEIRIKMLERELNWARLRTLQLAGILITVSTALLMAWQGAGVYALIVPSLVGVLPPTVDLFYFERWRPNWRAAVGNYSAAWKFGLSRVGSNALNSGRSLFQSGWVTHHHEFGGLGVMGRADGLANLFCGRVALEVGNALYPVVTRAEAESSRFQHMSGLVLRAVAWAALPAAAFCAMHAQILVDVLYGPKWVAVADLLPMAAGSAAFSSVGATAYKLLLANNRTALCLKSDLFASVLTISAVLLLTPFGLTHLMLGLLAVTAVIATWLVTLLASTRGIVLRAVSEALIPSMFACGVALLSTMMVESVLPSPNATVALVVLLLLFAIVYILCLRVIWSSLLLSTLHYLPGGQRLARILALPSTQATTL